MKHAKLALYLLLAFAATAPAWIVQHPPLTDLPYHLATIRVLHSLNDPHYGLADDFVLTLSRTQYVLYYTLGSALSYVLDVAKANVLLVCAYLGGTVLAMRDLLRALHKDERLCILVVPLLPNVLFMYGLFPFLVGIPIMLSGLALAVRTLDEPTTKRRIALGLLAIALFYVHVVPFGLFALGCAAMFPWTQPARWGRLATPLAPSAALSVWWLRFTEAGRITREAANDAGGGGIRPLNQALQDLPNWIGDIFRDTTDEYVLVVFAITVVLAIALSQGDRDHAHSAARKYAIVPLACGLAYFFTSEGHGFIWPLSQRFPVLALLTAIPLVRMPRGARGVLATTLATVIAGASIVNVCSHFIDFERREVGDLDGAIEAIPPRKHVAALIYDRGSNITNQMAFLHFGSYYQVKKGGVVMFTFAGYPHWPFDFRPGRYPPPGGPARPRWEWTPESVSAQNELYPYYDYVLTRGSGFRPPPGTFSVKWRGERWQVWERVSAPRGDGG